MSAKPCLTACKEDSRAPKRTNAGTAARLDAGLKTLCKKTPPGKALSCRQIAAACGVSHNTVGGVLESALRKMKNGLAASGGLGLFEDFLQMTRERQEPTNFGGALQPGFSQRVGWDMVLPGVTHPSELTPMVRARS